MRLLRRLAVTGLVAAAPALAGAQAASTPTAASDSVLARLWRLGMDSSQATALLQVLSDSIGPRLTGTPGQKAGNRWLVDTYKRWGVTARNEPYGTWRSWTPGTIHADLMTPRVRSLEATLLAWSPGTGGRDVRGPVVLLPELADSAAFARWLPQVRGKFVLISMPEASCRAPESFRQFGGEEAERSFRAARAAADTAWQRRMRSSGYTTRTLPLALENAGALGIVTSNWSVGWGVNKIFRGRTERVPSIDVGCEDYGLLARLAERNQGPTLRLRADATLGPDVPVWNTIAEIRGSEKPDEYVMLSAHFDSWHGGSGTTDNGTGTVVMMEALRLLRTVYPAPKRTILVGHWSGEEQGLVGSRAFAEDHPDVVKGLHAMFNQDNGTGPIRNVSGSGFAAVEPTYRAWLARLPQELTGQLQLNFPGNPGSGGTDHASFVCHGATAFGLGSQDWGYFQYTWHTNRDTYDKVVPEAVKANATMVAMLAYLAAEEPSKLPADRANVAWPECQKPPRAWRDWTR